MEVGRSEAMYGLVNKAIKDLVVTNHGEEKWEAMLRQRKDHGEDHDVFEVRWSETAPS